MWSVALLFMFTDSDELSFTGKKYSWIDATAACTMSIGLAVFILGDNKVSPMFNSTGYMMISAALLCDAVIGNVQEKFLKHYKASNNEMVCFFLFHVV